MAENEETYTKRRAALVALINEFGTIRALAEKTDSDAAHLSQIKNGTREMGEAVARRIENALGLGHKTLDRGLWKAPPELHPGELRLTGVPVVGTAQAGDDGYWHELQHPTGTGEGYVPYPTRDPNTYALRIKGDSMWPRINPGEFVVIEPNRAFVAGDEVMVQTKDGRSMIKKLGSRRGGLVELLSINGAHKPITVDEEQVEKIHYVGAIIKAPMYYEREIV